MRDDWPDAERRRFRQNCSAAVMFEQDRPLLTELAAEPGFYRASVAP